jgi:hypothetical protein
MEDSVTASSSYLSRATRIVLAAFLLLTAAAGTASAQEDPNPGAITLTAGIDFPSVYFFRGIRQEYDPGMTTFAFGDVGLALYSGDGGLKSFGVNFGVWNSLNTGSSGSDFEDGSSIHYEEDFYVSAALGFGGGITVTPMFTAYTSPNGLFPTVKELSFKVGHASRFAPYAMFAFELGDSASPTEPPDGQADAGWALADGGNPGTYLELGVAPSWALGGRGVTVGVPVKLGMSLGDYYESPTDGEDNGFGYFVAGALVTVPFSSAPTKFGSWNLHGGVDFYGLGDTTKAFNIKKGDNDEPSGSQVIVSIGIGLSY